MSISVPDMTAVGGQPSIDARVDLAVFREQFYDCLTTRRDVLFELTDAVLCAGGAVRTLVELSLTLEHRRGHGALYDGINCGRIEVDRLRRTVTALPLPRCGDGAIVLAVDVSAWLRPDAPTSPQRSFCHVYGRGKGQAQLIPGWQYSFIAALEPGRTSWTAVLDAVRLHPDEDPTAVTAAQIRNVVDRLRAAGHHRDDDPDILLVFDAGYDLPRLAFALADQPVRILGRMRGDRVLCFPAPPPGRTGRPPRHGAQFHFADPTTWTPPATTTATVTDRYGTAVAEAWNRLHPRLTHRGVWAAHPGPPPIVEGTVIRLTVEHLPGDRHPAPVWLWCSDPTVGADHVDRLWQMFLRRFDLEHTFRMFKQTLGWTAPKIRSPEAADRWTWIVIVAHTQLRLARSLAEDLRRPWERPRPPGRLTPARVRRGFPHIHRTMPTPAGAPKPSRPGPGRPFGSKNTRRAPHHHVGKRDRTDVQEPAGVSRTG
ncbi:MULTISPECIES: NF041680 family putative transposase [Rhodococcus]|nr:NF041680 family putative transposase [Rhodococcus aetherivorans]WKX00492.1 NF041680 family putative transposase [Rhodococcus aetherivorans]WKX00508.1 NF041680 family putative transposase [Rhodococcus aetherivorans]